MVRKKITPITEGDEEENLAKEIILENIDRDIEDIEEFEAHSRWRQRWFGCCIITTVIGVVLLMFGLGSTPMFESIAPHGGEMFATLGFSACCFVPLAAWLHVKFCPCPGYRRTKRDIAAKAQVRQQITDKRLRYLYAMDADVEESIEESEADKAINAQIKLAQINAQFEQNNKAKK